jgi:riboflavin synthase
MFAGLVEELGTVSAVSARDAGLRLTVLAGRILEDLAIGDSVAIDGVCQTVVARNQESFDVEAIATTLSRTTLGELRAGDIVNLERALAYGSRVGGHLVQGHVDGVGTVQSVQHRGEHVLVDVQLPVEVAEVTVLHGSIAIQGVSLTVNAVPGVGVAQVALIPHTWQHTNLHTLRSGSRVNVEGDLLGKFVVQYLKRNVAPGV